MRRGLLKKEYLKVFRKPLNYIPEDSPFCTEDQLVLAFKLKIFFFEKVRNKSSFVVSILLRFLSQVQVFFFLYIRKRAHPRELIFLILQ